MTITEKQLRDLIQSIFEGTYLRSHSIEQMATVKTVALNVAKREGLLEEKKVHLVYNSLVTFCGLSIHTPGIMLAGVNDTVSCQQCDALSQKDN